MLSSLELKISCLSALPLSNGITEMILASSGNTPYLKLLFIVIERGVLSIAAESLTNFSINNFRAFLNFNRISRFKAKRY